MINFARAHRFVERHEKIRLAEIAIVFGDFVFQNQMIAERVPGQLGDQAMVLVCIFAVLGEYQIRPPLLQLFFKNSFDFCALEGEEAIAKIFDDQIFFLRLLQK